MPWLIYTGRNINERVHLAWKIPHSGTGIFSTLYLEQIHRNPKIKKTTLKFINWAVPLALLISANYPLRAQTKKSIFRESVDNAFDISTWLLELHGFVPIISPITEPAMGYGAQGAGAYFIARKEEQGKGFQMPDIIGLAGGLTENGTWNAGAGFRYLLARQLGLQMGMDVGWGPDSWAFYIIFGSAWLR